MRLLEHQAKKLLSAWGIPVPRGTVITRLSQLSAAAKKTGRYPLIVKAQVYAGGRGKAGGVVKAKNAAEARKAAVRLLGQTLVTVQTGPGGIIVNEIMVEKPAKISKELYMSVALDRKSGRAALIASSEGGVDIEQVPFETPELKRVLHERGHTLAKVRELARCVRERVRWLRALRPEEWDVVVLYRELLPVGGAWLERRLARTGLPVIFDFDDAIYLPDVSAANRMFRWLKRPQKTGPICRLSAHVTVGTPYLEPYVRRFTDRVTVLPTTIDLAHYPMKPAPTLGNPPVIGWSGSFSTVKHLKTVLPALRRLRERAAFRLRIVGGGDTVVEGLDVECRPWTAATEVAELHAFDVGIMPLPDDAWSRGKCALKALQYMAVGVPAVVSPVGVNADLVHDGRNGFLAATDIEWVEKLSRLLADADLRSRVAREARRTVEDNYSAAAQAPRLRGLLERVRRRATAPAASSTRSNLPQEAHAA